MNSEQECKNLYWTNYGPGKYIDVIREFEWGWVVQLDDSKDQAMGTGPCYIDRETGLMSGHGSARFAEDIISEFGKLMLETKGLSKSEKEKQWNEKRQTFTSVGYF